MTHQLGVVAAVGYVDKRRSYRDDFETRAVTGGAQFTANAGGSTTTILGADATLATGVNVMRIGDEFKLFTAAGVLKEETVFRVTGMASAAGTTTITFTPAAQAATASTNQARLVGLYNLQTSGDMDRRLIALGFSSTYVSKLTENDKAYQLRTSDDPDSIK
jgi:hypothetical protein